MSDTVQATGIVIRKVKHGETSLVLSAFTRELGKVGLIGKGARGKSRGFSPAALELFCENQWTFYRRPGRDLHLLKECTITSSHSGLRSNIECLTVASAIAELLVRCVRDEDSHPDLFDSTSEVLGFLDTTPKSPVLHLWRFELSMFASLGFAINFGTCGATSRQLTPPFTSAIRYNLDNGYFLHPETASTQRHHGSLSADSFSLLAHLPESGPSFLNRLTVSPRMQHEITDFLHKYLEAHLPVTANLRSLQALNWNSGTALRSNDFQASG